MDIDLGILKEIIELAYQADPANTDFLVSRLLHNKIRRHVCDDCFDCCGGMFDRDYSALKYDLECLMTDLRVAKSIKVKI